MFVFLIRRIALVLVLAMVASSCRVATDDVALRLPENNIAPAVTPPRAEPRPPQTQQSPPLPVAVDLPAIGPIPGFSHWHAAYVVRICDDVLQPFDSTDDPLGIHSHADGLMHIHPFFESSGYEDATVQLFADAMGLKLADGEITLPGGGTWRDGDLCDGVPGRVFVDRWKQPDPESDVERIFEGLDQLRYEADGELYQIAFAPADTPPVVPPAQVNLDQVSDFTPPPEPWVELDGSARLDTVRFWTIGGLAGAPCPDGYLPEQVLSGTPRCFAPGEWALSGQEAVASARAVAFNRNPAVEIKMAPALRELITEHFIETDQPMGLGIEVDGAVVLAPLLARPPVADRLVLSGGMTKEVATSFAALLNGE